ncbi:hypothetical protein CA51_24930 [Rosistilla oblonga]|uniref:DUF192 domain-containing protein n=1 Tax=Rosistilla oblonga TaxID=2527990 RepID=UPI00118C401C|nr:DUF192 domain-containing protein [Rosistilla oblonga]QDV12607.1 hypothetical protein CA51_24930 [Rosistilla oblonga]
MRFPILGRWEDAETGEVLAKRLYVAETFWQRLRGLQFAQPLDPGCGLLLRNCGSVHTMWMRFPIDLFFLDEDWSVLEVRSCVKPWRVVIPKAKRVSHVIEVTSGQSLEAFKGRRTKVAACDDFPIVASGKRGKEVRDAAAAG